MQQKHSLLGLTEVSFVIRGKKATCVNHVIRAAIHCHSPVLLLSCRGDSKIIYIHKCINDICIEGVGVAHQQTIQRSCLCLTATKRGPNFFEFCRCHKWMDPLQGILPLTEQHLRKIKPPLFKAFIPMCHNCSNMSHCCLFSSWIKARVGGFMIDGALLVLCFFDVVTISDDFAMYVSAIFYPPRCPRTIS